MLISIYMIKENFVFDCFSECSVFISNLFSLFIPILLSRVTISFLHFSSDISLDFTPLAIEDASNAFLPSYLGYFFVALSINSLDTLAYIYVTVAILTFCSQSIYYNPFFLLMGYNFYFVTTSAGKKVFVISRKEFNVPNDVMDHLMKKVNNFTYIQIDKER